jgi:glutaredoxin-like protein
MALMNDQVKEQIGKVLSNLKEKVNIVYFTQELECGICHETRQFLDEFCSLSDKLTLTSFNFVTEKEKVSFYGIERIPGIALLDAKDNDTRIRFYGLPAGYEINSFISALLEVSGVKIPLPNGIEERIKKINKQILIQVFVSLTCPYCPDAVHMAHRLALENPLISAEMIDTAAFTPLAIKHNITGVPKTIINGNVELTGLQPIESLVEAIEKV